MSKDKKKSGMGKFIAGAAIGAGLGNLFAQKAGSETIKDLTKKQDELVTKIKKVDAADVKKAFEDKVEEIKAELDDLDKEKVLKIAKQKGNDIKKKCQELVNLAIAKGTPVLESAAEDVRLKAIDFVNEVLVRLENAAPDKKK